MSRKAQDDVLPKGWREVKIIDFSPLQRGFDLPAARIKEGTYPVVYSNGVKNYHSEYKAKAPGVVTGRSGTIGEVTYVTQDYWPHNTSLWVTDFKGNHPKFVFYFLQNLRLDRFYAGSGVPTLNRNDVHKKSVLIPALPEQKAIASLLEKWDTAIEKTEALIEAKEKRFKWLLKTLISDQQDNPEWQKVKLGEISTCYSGGTPSTQVPEYYDGEIPFINSGDLNQRHIKSVKGMLSTLGVENSSAKFVKKNTLLMALYGATAGVVAITHIDAVINQAVLAIVVKKNHYNNFIFFGLEQIKNTLVKKYRQGGQPNLSAKIIKSIKLRLPSLPEQKRIANILDTAKQEVEFLNQLTEQYRTQKRGLMQKLLTGKWRIRNQNRREK